MSNTTPTPTPAHTVTIAELEAKIAQLKHSWDKGLIVERVYFAKVVVLKTKLAELRRAAGIKKEFPAQEI